LHDVNAEGRSPMKTLTIRGIIPPMLTPFTEEGELDEAAHVRNLKRWERDELGGYLVLGSNGETPFLTETEKLKLIDLTVEHASKTVIAGTGLESTRETIRFTKLAAERGARAALVLTPCFFGAHMTGEALVKHFRAVADDSTIPILLYSVPAYTHLAISVDAVASLSKHPNIIGMKDSSGDMPRFAALKNATDPSFNLIVGNASALYPALALGAHAAILAVANFAGTQCAAVQRAFERGDLGTAKEMFLKLVPVNAAVTATYGIAGLKEAATMLGYDGGSVRRPLLPVDEPARKRLRELLTTAGLL